MTLSITLPNPADSKYLNYEVEKSFLNAKKIFFASFSERDLIILFDCQTEDDTRSDIEPILRKFFLKRLEDNLSKSGYKQFVPQCFVEKDVVNSTTVRCTAFKDFFSDKSLEFVLESYDYILNECEDYVWLVAEILNNNIMLSLDESLSVQMIQRIQNTLYFEKGVKGEQEFKDKIKELLQPVNV